MTAGKGKGKGKGSGRTGRRPAARRGGRNPVAAARSGSKAGLVTGIAVVVVLAVAVAVGVGISMHRSSAAAEAEIPVAAGAGLLSVPVSLDKPTGTVVVGKPTAKIELDVYEDFLCPHCAEFEHTYGPDLHSKLAAGSVKVRYHMINLLDDRSDPPGYSTLAASAALSVAQVDPAKFVAFHDSLFAAQPAEGARGYDAGQLSALATKLGVKDPALAGMVQSVAFRDTVAQDFAKASNDPALRARQADGSTSFGTPTVAAGGKLVDVSNAHWLDELVSSQNQ